LGVANDYTEFTFSDSTRINVDSQGQVAVGGNATFNNFTVASSINSGNINGDYSLIVNKNLGGTQAVVQGYGDALYKTKDSGTNLYFNGGGTGHTGTISNFFSDAQSYLTTLSATLAGTTANGTTSVNPSGYVTLTGTDTSLDVFNLTGAQLAGAQSQGLAFDVPSSATVVVNIDGTVDTFSSFGIALNGLSETHILYNFTQATSLTINNIQIEGTILAPYATVHFNGGQINGSIIANSLTSDFSYGSGESHLHLFDGNLPTPAVPEPSSLSLIAMAGIMTLGPFFRRRKMRRLNG
jgi:choice-of-anchor A domain-containing protein